MGTLKGRNNAGAWVNASAVYGWNSSGVKTYAKAMFMRKADNTWERAWTDCRQHDATGGRDWIAAAGVTEYQGSCTSRESRVRTDYTKTGCTGYSRYTAWVAAPTCEGACTTAVTGTFTQDGIQYDYVGPAGYFESFLDGDGPAGGCADCPSGQFNYGYYYVTSCGGTKTINVLSCQGCQSY